MLCWFTESIRTAKAPPELRSDRHKDGRNKSLTFTYMKGGYSLSRAPKARAKKIFGIVDMKVCKITYLFTILLRATVYLKKMRKFNSRQMHWLTKGSLLAWLGTKNILIPRERRRRERRKNCVFGKQFHKNPLKSM